LFIERKYLCLTDRSPLERHAVAREACSTDLTRTLGTVNKAENETFCGSTKSLIAASQATRSRNPALAGYATRISSAGWPCIEAKAGDELKSKLYTLCGLAMAITQSLVEKDPLKIKYREALIKAVQKIVRGPTAPSEEVIEMASKELANPEDEAAFANMLKTALHHLHEGVIARYRLRRSEYLAWKQSEAGSKNS
jgi:hypothetical protein